MRKTTSITFLSAATIGFSAALLSSACQPEADSNYSGVTQSIAAVDKADAYGNVAGSETTVRTSEDGDSDDHEHQGVVSCQHIAKLKQCSSITPRPSDLPMLMESEERLPSRQKRFDFTFMGTHLDTIKKVCVKGDNAPIDRRESKLPKTGTQELVVDLPQIPFAACDSIFEVKTSSGLVCQMQVGCA